MVWSYRHPFTAQHWRQPLSLVATPVIYAANAPFSFFNQLAKDIESHASLVNENATLHAKVMILEGQVQKLQSVETENQSLKVLLKSSPVVEHLNLMLAEVMALQISPFVQEMVLNKGSHQGVFVGQAVLDAYGIMGQVIEVSPYSSRVLLLTDSKSGIPVQNSRTGMHGILTGQGSSGLLRWVDVPPTTDIKVGDLLLSSGMGGHYPVGYPVGKISHINTHTTDQFLEIEVAPSAQVNSAEQVLLVWSSKK
jgi:rod shape-determining protein MreC